MMKQKTLTTFLFSLVLILTLASFASAASLTISNSNIPTSVAHDGGSFTITFDLTNAGLASTLDWDASTVNQGATISFSHDSIADGSTTPVKESITATVTFPEHKSGTIVGNINVLPQTGLAKNLPFSVSIIEEKSLSVEDATVGIGEASTTITITNDGNTAFTGTTIAIEEISGVTLTYTSLVGTIAAGESKNVLVGVEALSSLDLGSNTAGITVRSGTTTALGTLTVEKTYCDDGEVGTDLELTLVEDKTSGTEDSWEWYPLSNVEIEVEVENKNQDDSKRVTVELSVYDVTNSKFLKLNDGDDKELEETIRIAEDESETFTFEFTMPADVEEADDYVVYVKAYEKGDEDLLCTSKTDFDDGGKDAFNQPITIKYEDDVGLSNIQLPEVLGCGFTGQFTADVYNFAADDDQQMRIRLFNQELGIDQSFETSDKLDEGDSEDISILFDIPKNAVAKEYRLAYSIGYDYKSSSDSYREWSDEKTVVFRVEGNCQAGPQTGDVAINAVLASEAKAGKDMTVKVTISNTGSDSKTFLLSASGFNTWAEMKEITPNTIVVDAGQSKEVSYVFSINDDATGSNQFTVRAIDGADVTEKTVSVTIQDAKSGFSVGSFGGLSWYIWAIILLNVILVLIILIVAVKLISSK